MILREGGNVFKDAAGQPRTQRINLADIVPTVRWLETVSGLELENNMLGSTGLRPTSGDLDLAVDSTTVDKNTFAEHLGRWVRDQGQDPRDWVRRSGTAVHFLTPIGGDPRRGYVQTDFMFVPKPAYAKFMMRSDPESAYKGVTRNVLLSSLAKSLGFKINATQGLVDRATERVITDDPVEIARRLLHPQAAAEDLGSVERIVRALSADPRREEKLRDFRDYAAREGIPFDEQVQETDVSFIARLRDRIVNQGMQPLVETQQVTESTAQPGVGGRAKGIEHLEDLVFRRATAGVDQALDILQHAAKSPATTTVKWDGKPAVIFGRKPATGEFVLTDGAGFEARGYDGLATSPAQMAEIQRQRSGDREGLIALYSRLFPVLEQATPTNFRGYVKGDLLYTDTPPVQAGNYVFQPNTVEYRIPARSGLGQRIGDSDIGIAMHTMYADQGDPAQPLKRVKFDPVPGLLLLEPIQAQSVTVDPAQVQRIRQVMRQHGAAIDTLFDPAELRQQQLTDLARLCVDYINHRIGTGNFDDLLSGFLEWLPSRTTPRKLKNITEYLRSPRSNMDGMIAAFALFLLLHELKMDVLQQLDLQSPGNEGWVMSTPAGYAKAVNRFDFTARNRARNNP